MTIDLLYGGRGADVLRGSVGIDQFYAADVLLAHDRFADFVGCGAGRDRADVTTMTFVRTASASPSDPA